MRRALSLLNVLPELFILTVLAATTAAFFIAGTGYNDIFRVVIYAVLALSQTVLALGHFKLMARSKDGLVAVWLVAFAYSKLLFAAILWGVVGIVLVTTLNPELDRSVLFFQIAYGLIGGGAASIGLSALIFALGYRGGFLDRKVRPYPFHRGRKRR